MDPWFITFIVFGAILVVVGGFTLFLRGEERRGGANITRNGARAANSIGRVRGL
jgi:hypothetical protein